MAWMIRFFMSWCCFVLSNCSVPYSIRRSKRRIRNKAASIVSSCKPGKRLSFSKYFLRFFGLIVRLCASLCASLCVCVPWSDVWSIPVDLASSWLSPTFDYAKLLSCLDALVHDDQALLRHTFLLFSFGFRCCFIGNQLIWAPGGKIFNGSCSRMIREWFWIIGNWTGTIFRSTSQCLECSCW